MRPKVVCQYLLEKMRFAGITKAFIVMRSGKWDIPAYLGEGSMLDMHLAYITVTSSWGVPFTLDRAYPFVRQAIVAFGFPDILFNVPDAFGTLLAQQSQGQSDILLGLCPGSRPPKEDAVEFDENGNVTDLLFRPADGFFRYSWAVAAWRPAFTEFLHEYVRRNTSVQAQATELTAGHVIKASLDSGLKVKAVVLGDEPYLDIGTPEDLAKATRRGLEGIDRKNCS
jgi:glucose-1-phosphate thymidylyltransferase